jgi:hypothetical protein
LRSLARSERNCEGYGHQVPIIVALVKRSSDASLAGVGRNEKWSAVIDGVG